MLVLFLILLSLFCYGAWEFHGHQRRLRSIPLRIHVNGSRGKSSVTRLIVAGLQAGGIRAVGKTTGTLPRIIDHEGKEISIKRNQPANIIEQVKIFRYIHRYCQPEALVIECMAVLPEYQWICEHEIVKSHIGVITNCRLDHINEMGHFRSQIAKSLGNTIPRNGSLFTSEKTNLKILEDIGKERRTNVTRVGGTGVTREELSNFSHIEHPANIGLALKVCKKAGVEREVALKGMYDVIPDPGALRVARCEFDNKEAMFINALAANDPESSLAIFNEIDDRFSPLGDVIILLNSRVDRQDRSVQLIEMVEESIPYDYFVLTGESFKKFQNFTAKYNIPKSKTIGLGSIKPEKIYEDIFSLIKKKGTIFAIGNVGAGGLDIARYFYKSRRKEL